MNKKKNIFIILLFCIAYILVSNIAITSMIKLPSNFYVNYEEVENANKENRFGQFVNISLEEGEIKTGDEKSTEGEVVFKLFGFIPVKKVKVKLLPEEEVYVGGNPIGLSLQTEGALVVSDTTIDASMSKINKNKILKSGDIITKINNQEIKQLEDIDKALHESSDGKVNIKYRRNNSEKSSEVDLIKDKDGNYKLGLWVRDDISGVGTLTFVKKNTLEYGALGHAVTNGKSDDIVPMTEGEIYSCSLVNIERGEKNNPGELRCVFVQSNKKGDVTKNTKVGIYGKLDKLDGIVDQNRTAMLGGRLSVKPGKAKIVSSVSGIAEEYDIEIIKANFQSKCDDKSLVIKVTDKKLLELTGGIVQGMSGSPILQNGKVVGAVTHVFVSDPTKGYGVYSDWMLEQAINQ